VAQAHGTGARWASRLRLSILPGHYARTEELIELAKVAGALWRKFTQHTCAVKGQNEVAAVREALRIGQEAQLPGRNISFKSQRQITCGQDDRNRADDSESARPRSGT